MLYEAPLGREVPAEHVERALPAHRALADATWVPQVVFTDPEVARVGIGVRQARSRWGDRAVVTRLDLREVSAVGLNAARDKLVIEVWTAAAGVRRIERA